MNPATKMLAVLVQLFRGADLLEDAVTHDHDPVAHGHGLDLVMRDVDHRRLETLVKDLGRVWTRSLASRLESARP